MSVEKKIELLWEGAKTLQKNLHTHNLLKSYYINTCKKLAKIKLQVPKEKFAISQMCPHCCIFWNDSDYRLKLIRKQIKNRSKSKRLIDKLEQTNGAKGKFLNKSQKKRAKWLKKKASNHLAIKCHQCNHRSLLNIENPKCKPRKQLTNLKSKRDPETLSTGLGNMTKNQQKLEDSFNSKTNKQRKTSTPAAAKSKMLKQKEKLKLNKSMNKDKRDTKSVQKFISKTQNKNSLLQLAALLQKQSKVDCDSTKKRLQSFLK